MEKTALDVHECLSSGPVQLRWRRFLDVGGQTYELGYHREVRNPGDDLSDLPADTRASIEAHWTPARVAAWQAQLAASEAEVAEMAGAQEEAEEGEEADPDPDAEEPDEGPEFEPVYEPEYEPDPGEDPEPA